MAGNILNKYGTNNQAITITLASLASSTVFVGRASTAIDNTVNLFQDALLIIKITTAGTLVAPSYVTVYGYGTVDGGTTYTEAATGTDAGLTLANPPNARIIGTLSTPVTATGYIGGPWSVAAAFGGVLPDHWGIIVVNTTGVALSATEGNHLKLYQGVYSSYT
jgi:hypothetical protein